MTLAKNFTANATPAEGDFFPSWLAAEGSGSERKSTLAQLRAALFGTSTYAVGDLLQASSTTALAKLAAVATGNVLLSGGVTTASAWGKVTLTGHVSGTLGAANGGTGNASYTVGDLLQASGSTALTPLAAVATGKALISGGITTASTWGKIGLTTHISGTLGPTNGGTGIAAYTQGDIVYSDATDSLAKLAKNTTATRSLTNTGTNNAPAWAQVDLTNGVTGVLPTANGGAGFLDLRAFLTGTEPTSTSATPANATGLTVTPVSGVTYNFDIQVMFRSSSLTGGLVIALTYGTATYSAFNVSIPQADGLGGEFRGRITASGGSVTSAAVPAANVTHVARITGSYLPTATTAFQVQFGSEDGAATITIKDGSCIVARASA